MPGYRGHLAAGVGAYALVLVLLSGLQQPILNVIAWFFCVMIGALTPDIDISSKGQKYFYRIIFLVLLILFGMKLWFVGMGISLLSLIPAIVPHRGIFHRLWFWLALSVLFWAVVSVYMPTYVHELVPMLLFFLLGIISHLVSDRMIR